jgi:hypothetical protein
MTPEEDKEYELLIQKRESNKLTNKEWKRYKVLVNKAIFSAFPKITKAWADGFNMK